MTESKHTQGRWQAAPIKVDREDWADSKAVNYIVIDGVRIGQMETLPDARMAAAAPDLLRFAQQIVNIFEYVPDMVPLVGEAKAAIAKAQGKP